MTTAIPISSTEGMGAIPYDGGTAFRVWTPFASSVSVVGSFNNWTQDENPLTSLGNGYWYAEVPNAKIGDEYRYAGFLKVR